MRKNGWLGDAFFVKESFTIHSTIAHIYIYIYIYKGPRPRATKGNDEQQRWKHHEQQHSDNEGTTLPQRDQHKQRGNHGNPRLHLKRNANFRRIREMFKRTIKHHADPFGNVINLSKHKFSIPEYKLLGKNLNFCPMAGKYNKKTLTKETNEFLRRAHFGNNTNNQTTEENIFKPRSNWQPKQVHHTVNTFCEAISNEINKHVEKKTSHNNLTKKEIRGNAYINN